MKKDFNFKGTINGQEYTDVEKYQKALHSACENGTLKSMSMNTHISMSEDKEEQCTLPGFDKENLTKCDYLKKDTVKEVSNISWDDLKERINNLSEEDLKNYKKDVDVIRKRILSDHKNLSDELKGLEEKADEIKEKLNLCECYGSLYDDINRCAERKEFEKETIASPVSDFIEGLFGVFMKF